ncbi:unnamed protein product [Rodentolepis nana]|uniref:F-box domain-containing protein n=1 Tax=Rodentolepis nana TaxID=102285 RepID=A0A0R3TVF9_RODNA|nr:unnamed protein product [Rodentolepis nana]
MAPSLRITDLPCSLPLEICRHLTSIDLLNFCDAFPQWKHLLSTRTAAGIVKRDIQNWTWMDRKSYDLVFPKKSTDLDKNLIEALLYYQGYHLNIEKFKTKKQRSDYSICEKLLGEKYPPEFRVTLNFNSSTDFDDSIIERLHFEADTVAAFTMEGYDFQNFHYYRSVFSARRRELENNACIVYFARSNWRQKSDIEAIFADAKTNQTVLIAIVKDEARRLKGYKTNLDFLNGFINEVLGGMEQSPLKNSTTNWCLWLVEERESKYVDAMQIYKRACYEIVKNFIK